MAELVAKSVAAVAIDENLTTLIDWVNIEQVSGFTVQVENAGGGSANDITDVQIDTSDDGGVTADLDQHAGVPAVPIGSGSAKTGTFNETAKFLRVRALCAAGEDTTADAWLLADSSVGRICTVADLKDRLGLSDTENDQLLATIARGVESLFNSFTHRELIVNAADVTEYFTGCGQYLQLDRWPIVGITSVKESILYDFDAADALVEDTAWRKLRNGKNGILYCIRSKWQDTEDSIQVIYRGGYCSAGQTPGAGEYAMPDDLREAAIEQGTFLFKRKDDIGLAGVSAEGGSISKFTAIKLLPLVEQVLKKYRKPSL